MVDIGPDEAAILRVLADGPQRVRNTGEGRVEFVDADLTSARSTVGEMIDKRLIERVSRLPPAGRRLDRLQIDEDDRGRRALSIYDARGQDGDTINISDEELAR